MFSPEKITEGMKNKMPRMSPRRIASYKKEMMKQEPNSFFSMKVNPEGASIGNFVDSTRRAVEDTKKFFTNPPSGSRRRGIRRIGR